MPIFRVHGRTLGILGFGKIGQTLAAKAQTLGLQIMAHDAFVKPDIFARLGVESVGLDDLFMRADFISIHTPLTPDTRGLVNAARLRLMKPTAFLINTARGPIIDQAALLHALHENWIAGAALDVFDPETLPPEHPLLAEPDLITTPHVAFYSEESVLELEIKAARNVAAVLGGRRPEFVVNPEVLNLPRWEHLRPL
jgi:D-3-phosphoglycerate dehydrogenase